MDNEIHIMLANIWFFIIGLMLFLYVVLDGFDLGVGILSLFARDNRHRTVMMASLESIWDANETWLVLVGGSLFGAFPVVYAVALETLYIPIMVMLFALIFRGVAFEFSHHAEYKTPWHLMFGGSSLLAAMAQGVAFGGIVGGLGINDGVGKGDIWGWLTPFSIIVAAGVVAGYALLGATYLIIKTEGPLQQRCIRQSYVAAALEIVIFLAVIVSASHFDHYFAVRWAASGAGAYLNFFIVLSAFAFIMVLRSLRKRFELSSFIWSVVITLACLSAMTIGYYPYMIPASILLTQAASSTRTLIFMLATIGFLIPVMITYSGYQYLVFRGKVQADTLAE